MQFSADLIDERLWLGNIDAAENLNALKNLHITHIMLKRLISYRFSINVPILLIEH